MRAVPTLLVLPACLAAFVATPAPARAETYYQFQSPSGNVGCSMGSLGNPTRHFGYGAGGAHFCSGANLARREIRVLFEELHNRIPDIVAIEEPAIAGRRPATPLRSPRRHCTRIGVFDLLDRCVISLFTGFPDKLSR
jgi:hypothetical protein